VPHRRQIAEGSARVRQLLAPYLAPVGIAAAPDPWQAPIPSAESRFRARAKLAVTGTATAPVLTLPGQRLGADLCDCPLYPSSVEEVLEGAKALIRRAQVPPYDVARRRGEIKNVLVTVTPDGEHQMRLVLRSERALDRIREHLPALLSAQPSIVSVTANLHPEHTSRVEGAREIHLAGTESIPVRTGDVTLFARPQSFLQTNTEVAGQLYRQGAAWIARSATERGAARPPERDSPRPEVDPPYRVWDLYCGLGGFALHTARALPRAEVTGIEVSAQAIDGAREAAAAQDLPVAFLTADATGWAAQQAAEDGPPDAVIVNPPRRGLGRQLSTWLESSGVRDVVYSSCNPTTLAADLAQMPSLRIVAGRWVDMFPHTEHAEVIVRLLRTDPA
jgi:23S rRNA (uracil747-C5)-methyltransferase